MLLTQGTFGMLPDLDDDEIEAQLRYALDRGWSLAIELTDDPHPRNTYWEMWGLPMFDLTDPRGALSEVQACRRAFPGRYVRITAFDNSKGRETIALSFLVQRPAEEPGFRLERTAAPGRTLGYTTRPYAADRPHGDRYR
jgi:ribulose-bisphosphate carboxylase small chain